jgi:hypothetical protein
MEVRSDQHQLTSDNVGRVPVPVVRFIIGAGEINGYPEIKLGSSYPVSHVRMLRSAGKDVLVTLDTDKWATLPMADWQRAVERVAEHVPSPVIEVGNEVGLRAFHDNPRSQWPAYWLKLRAASKIIRAAGKKCLLGAMPPSWGSQWFASAALNIEWSILDGVGYHPYMPTPADQLRHIRLRRDQLHSYGCRAPFYFSEFGWSTLQPPENLMCVTEPEQAKRLAIAFANFRAEPSLLIEWACVFSWADWQRPGPAGRYGVLRTDGSAKPSYNTLKQEGAR